MLLTESGQGDDSHNEPVSKVIWVPDTTTSKKNKYLVSTSEMYWLVLMIYIA